MDEEILEAILDRFDIIENRFDIIEDKLAKLNNDSFQLNDYFRTKKSQMPDGYTLVDSSTYTGTD